jgi:exodeoxyribonuclease-3
MTLISFNINGIRARLHQLEALLEKYRPTLLGLQETKVHDSEFPEQAVRDMGYHPYYFGQKGHYGVALLTREPLEEVHYGFPSDDEEAQRRMIIGRLRDTDGHTVTVLNGYFPQGENRAHPIKFPAKRKFYQDLQDYLESHHRADEKLAIMGDFNISSTDLDIGIGEANRKRWLREGKTSFLPEEREWWQRLVGWGLTDTFRHRYPDTDDVFSWFDYRSRGFERDPRRGLRIDTVLVTAPLLERLDECGVDYPLRAMEKPSDHCPVWTRFSNLAP